MIWDDPFGITFCSVAICLVQARPGEFDPAAKPKLTFYTNVAVTSFTYRDLSCGKALTLSLAKLLLLFLNDLKIPKAK